MQNITPIFPPSRFTPQSAVEVQSVDEAALFYRDGIPAKHIFLHADGLKHEDIRAAREQCRYLVSSHDALSALDAALDGALPAGYLDPVGLCVGAGGFARDIPVLAAAIRQTRNLTLRYAFLSMSGSGDLSAAAREAFSFVKKLRADVPCVLHGFCFRGLLEPFAQGDAGLEKALQMLAALNDSSLYAEFFIA